MGSDEQREPTEITYSEQFYPARPRAIRPRARLRSSEPPVIPIAGSAEVGEASGLNPAYVAWLTDTSMLQDAIRLSSQLSGHGSMWQ
ncbi:MAG: maltose alpha-D-glucosyltransferase, partial [Myxococcales bacterium]